MILIILVVMINSYYTWSKIILVVILIILVVLNYTLLQQYLTCVLFCCCSSDKQCPILMYFLRSGIHFASVDITNDKIKMRRTWGLEIPSACHIDLQRIFKLENDKTGMADMAVAVIEEDDYAEMKTGFPKTQHDHWEKTPLDACNI